MSIRHKNPLIAAFPEYMRPCLAPLLPDFIIPRWFADLDEAASSAPGVEIGWYDFANTEFPINVLKPATELQWLFTLSAGIEHFPFDLLRQRGVRLSNGAGINAATVAEYAVMGILVAAKRFDEVIRAHDRSQWLTQAPGQIELAGTRALIVGYGQIGDAIGERLKAFSVDVVGVRTTADSTRNILGPDNWKSTISDYDWIIIAAPSTPRTQALIDRQELAAMKSTAWIVNIARGTLVARDPLIDALARRSIGGAFLDVTDPEPLPPNDPMWNLPNTIVTMHLSGRSQSGMFARAARLFLSNLNRFLVGAKLENEIDLLRGY